MTVVFLDIDSVRSLQAILIDEYGGLHGLRDETLLRSALDSAENRFHYEPGTTIPQLAAALGWGLIKNHVFVDGNKRIGLAAVLTFLWLNGFRLGCPEDESEAMTLRAAASEISESEWTAWLERVVRPLAE